MFNIEEELKKLPNSPGVYLMHGAKDEVIYVGKAVILKNRVRQYFRAGNKKSPKIEKMVSQIKRFEYIVTDSEMEALVLESNLIKEYRPKYNTMLKDDKSYPYVRVTVHEDFPRVQFARRMKKDKCKYFGPFTSSGAVKDTIALLQKIYKLRNCSKNIAAGENGFAESERPCLNYHIGLCDAPCAGMISKEDYALHVENAISFLEGDFDGITKQLQIKMQEASDALDFEKAMEYRDLINSIAHVAGSQKVTTHGFEDRDIIAYAKDGYEAVVQVFFVREGKLIGREHFYLKCNPEDGGGEILSSFIKQYYGGTPFIPHELMVQEEIEDKDVITEWLSSNRKFTVKIVNPKKGDKEKLMELARKNAKILLDQNREKYRREQSRTTGAVNEITALIGIGDITRIESFDISHISGFETVASMVVYENGKPKRNNYRKFKINSVKGPDDYLAMEEVLTRRFAHAFREREKIEAEGGDIKYGSFTNLPDLILMDGGKGQVNIALKVLEKFGLNIPVCGMVKDDSHRTRGLYYNNEEIAIDTRSEGFKLITRIQDETHRFAIEFHRSLRTKEQVHSVLDDIEGIGPKRRKALLKAFSSVEEIAKADVEALKKVDGMNESAAVKVHEFFITYTF